MCDKAFAKKTPNPIPSTTSGRAAGAASLLACASLLLPAAAWLALAAQPASAEEVTISTLSNLRKAELERKAQEEIAKLSPPAPKPAASAAAAPAGLIFKPFVPPPAPRPAKRVLAIYGPIGREMAEVQLPSGHVVRLVKGSEIDDFRVLAVAPDHVELERMHGVSEPGQPSAPARHPAAAARRAGPHAVRHAAHVAHGVHAGRAAASPTPTPPAPQHQILSVKSGGTFD